MGLSQGVVSVYVGHSQGVLFVCRSFTGSCVCVWVFLREFCLCVGHFQRVLSVCGSFSGSFFSAFFHASEVGK